MTRLDVVRVRVPGIPSVPFSVRDYELIHPSVPSERTARKGRDRERRRRSRFYAFKNAAREDRSGANGAVVVVDA